MAYQQQYGYGGHNEYAGGAYNGAYTGEGGYGMAPVYASSNGYGDNVYQGSGGGYAPAQPVFQQIQKDGYVLEENGRWYPIDKEAASRPPPSPVLPTQRLPEFNAPSPPEVQQQYRPSPPPQSRPSPPPHQTNYNAEPEVSLPQSYRTPSPNPPQQRPIESSLLPPRNPTIPPAHAVQPYAPPAPTMVAPTYYGGDKPGAPGRSGRTSGGAGRSGSSCCGELNDCCSCCGCIRCGCNLITITIAVLIIAAGLALFSYSRTLPEKCGALCDPSSPLTMAASCASTCSKTLFTVLNYGGYVLLAIGGIMLIVQVFNMCCRVATSGGKGSGCCYCC